MRTYVCFVAIAIGALVVCAAPTRGDVIGPLLPRKAIEIGFTTRDTDRLLEYADEESRFEQTDIPLTIRYGISSTATLSIELDGNPLNRDEDAVFYTVGASIQGLIWREREYAITTSVSYARTLGMQENEPPHQIDEQRLCWTLLGQRVFDIRNQELTVWVGPLVSYMSVTPQAPAEEDYLESQNLMGGVVGAGFLFVKHLVLQGQLVYVDEPEYRLNLAYRF